MLCSWVCWKLLLVWALLLGQPVCGTKQCCCQPCNAPLSEQGTQQSSPKEESEQLRRRKLWEMNSEERMERTTDLTRRLMEEAAIFSPVPVPDYLKRMAVAHYNQQRGGPYYKRLEDAHLQIKEANGTMAYIKLVFVQTNCTLDDKGERGIMYTDSYLDQMSCMPLPESAAPRKNCTIGIFIDEEGKRKVVMGERCMIWPTHIQGRPRYVSPLQ